MRRHDEQRAGKRRGGNLQRELEDALEGTYRIDRELGRGGMATVYLAHDIRHNRRVAVKVLHPDLATSIGSERFLREIQLTALVQCDGAPVPQAWSARTWQRTLSLNHLGPRAELSFRLEWLPAWLLQAIPRRAHDLGAVPKHNQHGRGSFDA